MREKMISMLLVVTLMVSLVLTGCSGSVSVADSTKTSEKVAATNETEESTTVSEPVTELTEPEPVITAVQQNSINMLNYLAFVTEEIYTAKDNRLILEDIYSSLMNEINPGTIDEITQDYLGNLRDVIRKFLNIEIKRERLQYIYNQEKASSMKNAIPEPLTFLSVTDSEDWQCLVASVAVTLVDFYNDYKTASENAEQEFLLSGWELDDEETDVIQQNREYAFDYMVDIVQEYVSDEFTARKLGMLTLNEKAVENFAIICSTNEIYRKIQLLEAAENTYRMFGRYWLELADCYYEIADYPMCLDCVAKYNELATGIFRKDFNLVPILPKAITAAQEVYKGNEYVSNVAFLADAIVANTSNDDWAMRYFAAQVYIDLYARTKDDAYLWKAYEEAKNNISELIDEQCHLNEAYLSEVQKLTVEKPDYQHASEAEKRELKKDYRAEKKRVRAYNKKLEKIRETELPPLYEPLILNCDLLFALAEQIEIGDAERLKIQKMLRTESGEVFLSKPVNVRYSFNADVVDASIEFRKDEVVIPANLLVQGTKVTVSVENESETETFEDYALMKVKRDDSNIESFFAYYSSELIKSVEWSVGTKVTVRLYLGEGYAPVIFEFEVTQYKNNIVFPDEIMFEAI